MNLEKAENAVNGSEERATEGKATCGLLIFM